MGCTTSQVTVVREIKNRPSSAEGTKTRSVAHGENTQHVFHNSKVEKLPPIGRTKNTNGVTAKTRSLPPDDNKQNVGHLNSEEVNTIETSAEQIEVENPDNDEDDVSLPDMESAAVSEDSGKPLSPTPRRFSPCVPHSRPGETLSVESIPDVIDNLPRPPKRTKRDLVAHSAIFKEVDNHAMKAPPQAKSSVRSLCDYLVKPIKTDLQKARAIYRWITHNIRYDTDSHISENVIACDAESVLRSGAAVCHGYSELFKSLCLDADVECLLVTGFAKEYPSRMSFTTTDKSNHAWNAVYLESDWHFVDCTWGSGHLNDSHQYIKQLQEGYFLTDPHHFISNHFPWTGSEAEDSRLQLLERPITLDEYNEGLNITVQSMEYNVNYISHSKTLITFENRTEITLKVQPNTLSNVRAELSDSLNKEVSGCVMILEDSDGFYRIHLSAPQTTFEGTLTIVGRDQISEKGNALITYIIHCKITDPDRVPKFPKHRGKWGIAFTENIGLTDEIKSQTLLSATNGETVTCFKTTQDVDVSLQMEDVDGTIIERATLISPDEHGIKMRTRCPAKGYYKLTVLISDGTFYNSVGTLLIHSLNAYSPFVPFPETFTAYRKHKVTLLQPIDGHLLPETEYKFKIHSPLTKKIVLQKTVVEDSSDGVFELTITTTQSGDMMTLFGSTLLTGTFSGYFKFNVI